jgi:thiol-disulfide isomerase/thioredoxin
MKKPVLFLLSILMLGLTLKAQDSSFAIHGKLEKIKSGTIYLNIYEGEKTVKDSAIIKNGIFKFTGFVAIPYFASLTMPLKPNDYYTFYIEPVKMEITGRADSLKLLSIKGSAVNDDDKMLKDRMRTISLWEEANSKIYEQAYKDKNKVVLDSLDEVDYDVLAAKRKVVASFVKDHPKSMRGAMAILENYSYYAEASEVQPLYNLLDKKIKNSPKGKEIKKMADVYATVAIGKQAPEIVQFTPDSNQLSLSSLKGKYILVDFWASWCGPCRRENPNIVAAYNQFKDKGFTIFGVSYDTKKDRWLKAIADDHLGWYQVSDLQGWKNSTSAQYGIKAIPSNVLIDKDGVIIAKNIFGNKLMEKLSELMK